jgi:SAM-dependent methyltransferase
MNAIGLDRTPVPTDWFASWFDSLYYRRLYAHRDEEEAARFIDLMLDRLQPADGSSMLDLGCGAGRHARSLAARGFNVTGLDLSAESIREAKRSARPGLYFARHDMRRPFGDSAFDHVFNLFTSFGYFAEAEEHLAVVRNIAASLEMGGTLVLDYLNIHHAATHLKAEEVIERDGVVFCISRWTDADHIFKRIVIHDTAATVPIEYVERVARFTVHDFRLMLGLYGLRIEDTYGDYCLAPFDFQISPRLILVASKVEDCTGLLARQVLSNAADRLGGHAQVGREHRLGNAECD